MMSRHGDVSFAWGDGEHKFRLAIGQIRELQEKCNAGPYEILKRLARGSWRVDDIGETIRLGLIGGGMAPIQALSAVARYVYERPLLESVPSAIRILEAALIGATDEPLPKGEGEEETASPSPTEKSPSEPSTDGQASLASRQEKSTDSPSGNSAPSRPASKRRTRSTKGQSLPAPMSF